MSIYNARGRPEKRAVTYFDVFGQEKGPSTYAGSVVTEKSALNFSIVWASVNLIADAVSSMPPEAFTEDEKGTIEQAEVPSWIQRPHPEQNRSVINHQLVMSVLMWGNAYGQFLRRPSDAQIIGLRVLAPQTMIVEWNPNMPGYRRYKSGAGPWMDSSEIFHIQGPTLPGEPKGLSVIQHAKQAIGFGLTLEEFGARYFSQGSMAKVVLKTNKTLKSDQAKELVDTYERFHRGPGNWHRPAVMAGDGDVINISIPPEDAQFLQTREFQAMDIARWFRVPPHRVGIISKQTSFGSGLAEENVALVQGTYRPWILRFEEAYTAYSPGGEGRGIKIRLNDAALTRGSVEEQAKAWAPLVTGQIATPNEARKAIGLSPIEGGDKLITPPAPAAPGQQGNAPKKNEPGQTDSAAKEKDRERKSFMDGGTYERRDYSEVERTINRTGDSCPACINNVNPDKVPVHPRCNCDVETSRVATGRSIDEVEELMDLDYDVVGDAAPAALRPDIASTAKLDPENFRFSDLLTWVQQIKSTKDTGYLTVLVNNPGDEVSRSLWLMAQEAIDRAGVPAFVRSFRSMTKTPAKLYVMPIDASMDDLARLYLTLMGMEGDSDDQESNA